MPKYGVCCLVIVSIWIYGSRANETPIIFALGDKCDNGTIGGGVTIIADLSGVGGGGSLNKSNLNFPFPAGGMCDPLVPLECSAGRCQCKRGFTPSRNGTKCLEVGRNGLDSTCEETIQCWKSLLGRLSECNIKTGKCQCYESDTLNIVFHQGRCYYGEGLGDFCQIEGLCSGTTPNATCRAGTCQCKEGFISSWDKSRCIPIATKGLESPCEENVQCEKSALGTLSECNQEKMQCQCYRIPMVPTVFHQGRCYFGAALGDVCQVSPQCHAQTENSQCGRDGKCHCNEGHVPNGNYTLCLPIPTPADGTDSECVEDVQCTKALGHFSRCNMSKQKCECFLPSEIQRNFSSSRSNENVLSLSQESQLANDSSSSFSSSSAGGAGVDSDEGITSMVIVGSKCYSVKSLGQSCKFNRQCSAMTENSVCYNGMCECEEETHVTSQDGRKCLEIAKKGYHSPCDEDRQCQSSILGPLSRCNAEKSWCECSNVLPVVYYEKKCYFHRQLGATCESHSECKAGSNFFAECNKQGRCQCERGTAAAATDHSLCIPSEAHSHTVNTLLIFNSIFAITLLLM